MRLPKPIQYMVYIAFVPMFCSFSWACLMTGIARLYGKSAPVFRTVHWIEELLFLAACVFPFIVAQVAIAAITVKDLSLRALFWLMIVFTILGQTICFVIAYQVEGLEARLALIGFPLSLLLPVIVLIVERHLRSAARMKDMGKLQEPSGVPPLY